MSRDPEEERFARQNSRRYSGALMLRVSTNTLRASAFAIAVIVIVLCIVFLVYYLK
jgi:hypothetical protein